MEQLMLILPERIGSVFSYRSLSEDLRVSVPTVQNWMDILQRLFIVFKVMPYFRNIVRSIRKQPKYYLCDWSQVPDEGARFENFVACHLWKAVQVWNSVGVANLSLHCVRDRLGREVDFLVARDRRPWFLVECKLAETQLSESLRYFCGRLGVPGLQLVLKDGVHRKDGPVALLSAGRWLARLP